MNELLHVEDGELVWCASGSAGQTRTCSPRQQTMGFQGTRIPAIVLPVTANIAPRENELGDMAVAWLRDRLPANWEVGPADVGPQSPAGGRADRVIDLRDPKGTHATIAVEIRSSFGPRDVDRLLGGLGRVLRALANNVAVLVVTPWLSQRTQELLRSEAVNYLDLTGNAYVRLDSPAVLIHTQGAAKNPAPAMRGKARVRGPKAGRLLRTLLDFRPPYGVRDLAAATGLAPGYVSRLLDTLDREALIERSARGRVESVDVARVLARWAETYDVFHTNRAAPYLAPGGVGQIMRRLGHASNPIAVTGSFAAVRLAPKAGPALLAAYCDDPAAVADELNLIPTDEGANVVLMRPFDGVVWERTSSEEGVMFVAPSQAAIDCLTGNGRMPAEGEALVGWMTQNEDTWRLSVLSATGVKASE